jgi:tellurite methyltransferase
MSCAGRQEWCMADAPKRATLSADYQRDWPEYFDAVKGQPPRNTLLRALGAFEKDGRPHSASGGTKEQRLAIDIACGEGRDTRAMLERGWSVIAVDYHAEAVTRTIAALSAEWRERCAVRQLTMEAIATDHELARIIGAMRSDGKKHKRGVEMFDNVDLINASFALPFCDPEKFPALWTWSGRTLRPGGRFSGQFFGDRDEWQCVRPKSHVTRAQLLELLRGFEVEHLEEVEKDGSDAMGGVKHHHVFHVVGRRKE